MTQPAIEVQDLKYAYGDVQAVDGISFEVTTSWNSDTDEQGCPARVQNGPALRICVDHAACRGSKHHRLSQCLLR